MYSWGHTELAGSVLKPFCICSDLSPSLEMSLFTFYFQHPLSLDLRPGPVEDWLGLGLRACLDSSLLPDPGLLWITRSPRKILRPHKEALAGLPLWAPCQAQMLGLREGGLMPT